VSEGEFDDGETLRLLYSRLQVERKREWEREEEQERERAREREIERRRVCVYECVRELGVYNGEALRVLHWRFQIERERERERDRERKRERRTERGKQRKEKRECV